MAESTWPRKCNHCGQFLKKTAYYEHKNLLDTSLTRAADENNSRLIEKPSHDPEKTELRVLQSQTEEIFQLYKNTDLYTPAIEQLLVHLMQLENIKTNTDALKSLQQTVIRNINDKIQYFDEKRYSTITYSLPEVDNTSINEECHSDALDSDISTSESESENTDYNEQEDAEMEVWEDEDIAELTVTEQVAIGDSNNSDTTSGAKASNLLMQFVLFLFTWQSIYNISSSAIHTLFLGIKLFLQCIADIFDKKELRTFADSLKTSLPTLRKYAGLNRDDFEMHICCPKCDSLYTFDESVRINGMGKKISNKCCYSLFPNHKQERIRRPCGTTLMKLVGTTNGQEYLHPIRVFCYRSIKNSIQNIASRYDNFYTICNSWRYRKISDNMLEDIYDGQVWKTQFQQYLDLPGLTLGLLLNVDWFQPYKHSTYSVGVVSLVLLNLPPEDRNRIENRIIVAILPGPHEAKCLNPYMKYLTDDLLNLESGFFLQDGTHYGNICRVLLMGISSDIPAVRKVAGFLGHSAEKGCSKCVKSFPRKKFGDKADYSGFEVCEARDIRVHKEEAAKTLNCQTLKEKKTLESKFGIRYSELLRLPYFNPIANHCIDALHNISLGSTKHFMSFLINEKIITQENLDAIQEKVKRIKTPIDIGRIPRKIACHFSGFSADEWKNWTLIYSLICLKGIIHDRYYVLWSLLVKACTLLLRKRISLPQLDEAHKLLIAYCKRFEVLVGKDRCTPNMHLHQHIKQGILDYGPVYGYWCYAFERLNGILGSYPHNNHLIEIQMMRRIVEFQQCSSLQKTSEFQSIINLRQSSRGTLADCEVTAESMMLFPYTETTVTSDEMEQLREMMTQYYPGKEILEFDVVKLSHKSAKLKGKTLTIESRCQNRYCTVLVQPPTSDNLRACEILELATFSAITQINSKKKKERFEVAKLSFFKQHTEPHGYAKPVMVFVPEFDYEPCNMVPLVRIQTRCAVYKDKVKFINGSDIAILVVPLPEI